MISGRPSKEQLEKYFRDSRKYFDDIAKHYKEVDRDYYNKYIEPFYSSPFGAVSSGTAKKAASAVVFAVAIFIAILGIVVFLLVSKSSYDNSTQYDEEVTIEEEKAEVEAESIEESDFEYKTNYEKGLYFYNLEKYKKAEKYFKRVKGTDSDYKDALRKLKEIKSIERENMDDGNARQQKLESPN